VERHAHHVEAEEAHPSGGVGLFQNGTIRKLFAPVDDGDVVEPKKPAFENVVALAIDPIDPPGKVDEQLVKALFEKDRIALAGAFFVELIDAPTGPGVDGRNKVGKLPLIGGTLPVGMLE